MIEAIQIENLIDKFTQAKTVVMSKEKSSQAKKQCDTIISEMISDLKELKSGYDTKEILKISSKLAKEIFDDKYAKESQGDLEMLLQGKLFKILTNNYLNDL